MNFNDFWSRFESILLSPGRFFQTLKERSIEPPIVWYAVGMFIVLFAGGPLSVLLSTASGVPVDRMVGFITGQEPGVRAFLSYVIFLSLSWLGSIIFALGVAAFSYGLSRLLGADSSYVKSVQMIAYCSTPVFIAQAVPQVLLIDTLTASPVVGVLAMWWNYSVDFLQLAALAWSTYLAWVGCRRYYRMSAVKTVIFFVVPLVIAAFLVGGLIALFALLSPIVPQSSIF